MLKKLIQISHIQLLGLFLLHFCLGCLLAMQTGGVVETAFFWIQLEWMAAFYLGLAFLNEYVLWLRDKSEVCGERKNDIPPMVVLGIAFLWLLFSLVLLYYRLQLGKMDIDYVLQLSLLLVGLLTVLPPIRFLDYPLNEVMIGIWLSGLSVLFGYFCSDAVFSAKAVVVSFGLLFQFLGFVLMKDLRDYTDILKFEQNRLLRLFGWQDGMFFYGSFLLFSYSNFGLAIGLSLFTTLYLTLMIGVGFGLVQVWNLRKIAAGGAVNWRFTSFMTYLNYFYPLYSLFVLLLLD